MLASSTFKKLAMVSFFATAMAMVESAVVIYLRVLYYPKGFDFPLTPIGTSIVTVEVFRELATIIMLFAVGWLAGKSLAQRFAYFILGFAVWDIFYYVWLKVFLGWPASFFTWDLLFLIPMPWVGPVITPLIVTVVMIALAILILQREDKGLPAALHWRDWTALIAGSLVIILSWVWDYVRVVTENHGFAEVWTWGSNGELFDAVSQYKPQSFEWVIFLAGVFLCVMGLASYAMRTRNVGTKAETRIAPPVPKNQRAVPSD